MKTYQVKVVMETSETYIYTASGNTTKEAAEKSITGIRLGGGDISAIKVITVREL